MKTNLILLALVLSFMLSNEVFAQSNVSWGEVKSTLSKPTNFRQVWLLFQQGGFNPTGNIDLGKEILTQKFECPKTQNSLAKEVLIIEENKTSCLSKLELTTCYLSTYHEFKKELFDLTVPTEIKQGKKSIDGVNCSYYEYSYKSIPLDKGLSCGSSCTVVLTEYIINQSAYYKIILTIP